MSWGFDLDRGWNWKELGPGLAAEPLAGLGPRQVTGAGELGLRSWGWGAGAGKNRFHEEKSLQCVSRDST